eukprot:503775-Rhodomonas_salina.2
MVGVRACGRAGAYSLRALGTCRVVRCACGCVHCAFAVHDAPAAARACVCRTTPRSGRWSPGRCL